jgi:hypothetical protein
VIALLFDAVTVTARMHAEVDPVPVRDVALVGVLAPIVAVAGAVSSSLCVTADNSRGSNIGGAVADAVST